MKSILALVTALALALSAFAQQLTINTPANVVLCEPILITWSGGTGPYFVTIVDGQNPTGSALVTFNQTSATSLTWLVVNLNVAQLGLAVRDANGQTAQSAAFSVATSNAVASCNSTTTSYSFGTTGATVPTTSGSSPTTITSATLTNVALSSTASGGAKSSAGSATSTSSTSTKSAGASRVTGQIAAAGIIGAAMVALLA